MSYCHRTADGSAIDLAVGKVVCVGRNYLEHIRELNNEVPEKPLLFMKPNTALVDIYQPLSLPEGLGQCHNETEIAVLIDKPLTAANQAQAYEAIWGYGIGLDLTLRELQSELKSRGHPWERAKAFDASCPMSGFVPKQQLSDPEDISFKLEVNQTVRQQSSSAFMMLSILELLVEISHSFSLLPGDIVLTGTPKGVAKLASGDHLLLTLADKLVIETRVA